MSVCPLHHGYAQVSSKDLWDTANDDIRPLREQIERYLADTDWALWEKGWQRKNTLVKFTAIRSLLDWWVEYKSNQRVFKWFNYKGTYCCCISLYNDRSWSVVGVGCWQGQGRGVAESFFRSHNKKILPLQIIVVFLFFHCFSIRCCYTAYEAWKWL